MIRRQDQNSFLLISQIEHARLSGALARKIGNASFSPISPFEDVARAIDLHDEGWPLHDLHPTINPQGLPRHVFEMDIHDPHILKIWDQSVDAAAAIGPYPGLLVSLQVLSLSLQAIARRTDLQDAAMRPVVFKANQFQHRQVERQEHFRKSLQMRIDQPLRAGLAEPGRSPEEDLLLRNFSILRLTDRLSLLLCFNELLFKDVENVYPKMGEPPVKINFTQAFPAGLRINPWPFEEDQLNFKIPAQRVPAKKYASDEDVQKTIATAPLETIDVNIIR